jgi:hypothetical protein
MASMTHSQQSQNIPLPSENLRPGDVTQTGKKHKYLVTLPEFASGSTMQERWHNMVTNGQGIVVKHQYLGDPCGE